MFYPCIQAISYENPLRIAAYFAKIPGLVFLNSSELREHCGRYSFIALDPFQTLEGKNGLFFNEKGPINGDFFSFLKNALQTYALKQHLGLPPFQGGIAGFFSYDLIASLENLTLNALDDMKFPDFSLGFYDLVMAFDHVKEAAWIFSSGLPLSDENAREARARQRLTWLTQELKKIPPLAHPIPLKLQKSEIEANFTAYKYERAVDKVKQFILDGDIFEANIAQRFKIKCPAIPQGFNLYHVLQTLNPAPFSAFLQGKAVTLISASPERFLKVYQNQVETRPIKGTRPRSQNSLEDEALAASLLASQKDHAENIMIVDLLRNDLSKVCNDHTVNVSQLCALESYRTVHHLVSVVEGQLKAGCCPIDVLSATFPGGSITGAPKIRAIEIIDEIEPHRRGPYCGSIGYIGFDGTMDTSISIRTFAIKDQYITYHAGGAVTLDSDPKEEYAETLTKAYALMQALIS